MIKNIFYDLDGTLLPMEMDEFMKCYFYNISVKMASHGYDPDKLPEHIWTGTKAMVINDGSKTNEEAFWECFEKLENVDEDDKKLFEDFYANEFDKVRESCGYNEKVPKLIATVRDMGLNQVLATNPLFPQIATQKRAAWAGINVDDFLDYTTYENCHYCKPNPKYYEELLTKLGMKAEETLMIGNDVEEDMNAASSLGMKVFLVTDHVLNPKNRDIDAYPHGDFDDALAYIKECVK